MFNRTASTAAAFIVITSTLTLAVQRDRISGVWASDSRRLLELKGEGRTVSGTVHFYQGSTRRAAAPIESASFDERTSGLRFRGRVTLPDGGHCAVRDRRHSCGPRSSILITREAALAHRPPEPHRRECQPAWPRRTHSPQVALCERVSGSGFQVPLESHRPLLIREFHNYIGSPRSAARGMTAAASIVRLQPRCNV